MQDKYNFIMKQCAPIISKQFTNLTSVINEGNSYEFPSADLHKAIINKLILNESHHFKQLFIHLKRQFKEEEQLIRKERPEFARAMDTFVSQYEVDVHKNLINIDQYMKDLKKHALAEYNELYHKEQQSQDGLCGSDQKNNKKKNKRNKIKNRLQQQ